MTMMLTEAARDLRRIKKLAKGLEFRDFTFDAEIRSGDFFPSVVLTCQWRQPERELITGQAYMHHVVLTDERMFMHAAKQLMISVMLKAMDTEARISLAKE
jgi:hypothetical protein